MLFIRKTVPAAVVAMVLCVCAGCGSRVRVEGDVTLDGTPVDGGTILFLQGTGPGSDKGHAPIQGGKYDLTGEAAKNLTPGNYTIQIHWIQKLNRPGPDAPNADTGAAVKDLIPAKYNSKTTLTRDLTLGTNKVDFELTSK
jgi:hypothetical protein